MLGAVSFGKNTSESSDHCGFGRMFKLMVSVVREKGEWRFQNGGYPLGKGNTSDTFGYVSRLENFDVTRSRTTLAYGPPIWNNSWV